MSRLNEDQVERLLKEAARWEPDAQMSESLIRSALTKSPRRKHTPLLPALSLSGAAFAGLLAFVVFRPEIPPAVVEPTTAPITLAQNDQTGFTPATLQEPGENTPQAKPASAPTQVTQKPTIRASVDKPSTRRNRSGRKHTRRSQRSAPETQARRLQPDRVEYAPDTYTNEPKPLPEDAIALDESPKIVPVVVADTDPETGEVLLRPAATVPTSVPVVDEPISLE